MILLTLPALSTSVGLKHAFGSRPCPVAPHRLQPQVYKSLVEGITEVFETNSDEIKLCEVKYANTYLTVHKDNWSGSLAKAMDFYIEKEQYEMCALIKDLTDRLWNLDYLQNMVD